MARRTTDEYLREPETVLPQELIYGMVRDAPAPTPGHQWTVGEFFVALKTHVEQRRLGRVYLAPIDVVLDSRRHLVVQPDLVFVSAERLTIVRDTIRGAPDLVVEVLSPQPRIGRLDERLAWFGEYGVRECWLVHQTASAVEVVAFGEGRIAARTVVSPAEPIRSLVLPDFTEPPGRILRQPLV